MYKFATKQPLVAEIFSDCGTIKGEILLNLWNQCYAPMFCMESPRPILVYWSIFQNSEERNSVYRVAIRFEYGEHAPGTFDHHWNFLPTNIKGSLNEKCAIGFCYHPTPRDFCGSFAKNENTLKKTSGITRLRYMYFCKASFSSKCKQLE